MYQPTSRLERSLLASLGVAVSAVALSLVTSGFLPADPHVEMARQQRVLDRIEHVREALAKDATIRAS